MKIIMEERNGVVVATVTRRFLWWTWTRRWFNEPNPFGTTWVCEDGAVIWQDGFMNTNSCYLLPALNRAHMMMHVRERGMKHEAGQ